MSDVSKTDGIFSLTQPVVMAFPNLFEAKRVKVQGKETGEPKFSANFVFPAASEDLKGMKQLAAKLARAKWPDKQFSELHFPFNSGDKLADKRKEKAGKEDGDYMRGHVVINAKSKYEPRLSYIEKGRIIDLENDVAKIAAKGKFYSGVQVLAQLNFVPYQASEQNIGITAYLNMVVSTCKGDRLSGGQAASETFKGYVGSVSAEDPTTPGSGASLDDMIGM